MAGTLDTLSPRVAWMLLLRGWHPYGDESFNDILISP
jgi:hypothetical protein